MTPPARSPQQRKHDALDRLDRDTDAWVATAGPADGAPYLVPLSFLWDGTALLIATPSASVTSRNLQATGRARLGVGPTRDVVMIEGTVQATQAAADIPRHGGVGERDKPVGVIQAAAETRGVADDAGPAEGDGDRHVE